MSVQNKIEVVSMITVESRLFKDRICIRCEKPIDRFNIE